jgi:hypothetical protein
MEHLPMHKVLSNVEAKLFAASERLASDWRVHSHERLCNGYYSIIAETNFEPTEDLISKGVAETGALCLISGSLKKLWVGDNNAPNLCRFIVARNAMDQASHRPYTESGVEGLKVITANVFADKDTDQIWQVVGEGANKRLVISNDDDLEDLLRQRKAKRKVTTASFQHATDFHNGDLVSFVHTGRGMVGWGIGLQLAKHGAAVFDSRDRSLVVISPAHVIEACDFGWDSFNKVLGPHRETARLSDSEAAHILGFLSRYLKSGPGDLMMHYKKLVAQRS